MTHIGWKDGASPDPSVLSVPHLQAEDLTAESFAHHYQKPGIPVVVSGLLPDIADWDLDYLCHHLGDREVPIRYYGRERYHQDKRQWTSMGSGVDARSMRFADYADLLRDGTAYEQDLYLGRCTLTDTPLADTPVLKQPETQLGMHWPATGFNLWLGSGGHTTCLHYDPMDGTLIQLQGAKRLIFFPPSQLYNLYPFSVWNHLSHGLKRRSTYSQVYPDRPDLQAFPKFQQAQQHRYEVILNPGEILFIPAGWWHEVVALGSGTEVVASVNRFWHVYPLSRAVRLWSKWRAHFGTALAASYITKTWGSAIAHRDEHKLREFIQRF